MAIRTITGLFDSRADAERAVDALVQQLGLEQSQISTIAQDPADAQPVSTTPRYEERGFWASLGDLFMPEGDRYTYSEGISRGGVLVSVRVEEAHVDQVADTLGQYGAVDLDQREAQWRNEGWTGYTGATAAGAVSDRERTGIAAMPGQAGAATAGSAGGSARRAEGEEHIPLAEERLRLGKRVADQGRVRVRSYVVETPVEEQVTLRDEHVEVERRSVDRPATDADRLFQDRTVEVSETSEEAVVSKEAVVREELVVRKEEGQHTETVRDTVRRTEVEVEDDRRAAGGTGKADPARNPGRDPL